MNKTLSEKLTDLTIENMRLQDIPERCAQIAESEPEPDGKMPEEFLKLSIEQAVRAAVRATKKSIAKRIRDTFDLKQEEVRVRVSQIQLENSYGDSIESIAVTCSRCGESASVFGRSDRSVRRGCSMLRERCPRHEKNFYNPNDDE